MPATFQVAPAASDTNTGDGAALPLRAVIATLVLALAAIAVLVVLPRWAPSAAVSTTLGPPPSPATTIQLDPAGADARLSASARRTAQILLRASLARVAQLRAAQVERWDRAGLHLLQEHIAAGEIAYREQRFRAAQDAYRAALVQSARIEATLPAVIAGLLKEGDAALAQGNAAQAAAAFTQVLAIEPAHHAAILGGARAATLDRVGALIEQAEAYEQMGEPEQARAAYVDAAKLDPNAVRVSSGLARLDHDARGREFRAALSAGHVALERSDFAAARLAFKRAALLDATAAEVRPALRDTARRAAAADIATALDRAARALHDEAWNDAALAYGAALAIDNELGVAAAGKRAAEQRAQLEVQLTDLATDIPALVDDSRHERAARILATANTIAAPGPRLRAQLAALTTALRVAREPVAVTLLSDGHSKVAIDGVGTLGRFSQQVLPLKPGHYRARLQRDARADVRIEFTIAPAAKPVPITLLGEP